MNVKIEGSCVKGIVNAPSSKSFAHRMIIAGFLSKKSGIIKNVGNSKDVLATLSCLNRIGLDYQIENGDLNFSFMEYKKNQVLDCAESGSTLRFLLPVVSALGIKASLTGSQRLLERPIDDLVNVLNNNGAKIDKLSINGKLKSGIYEIDGGISSQFITGLLLALPILDGDSQIIIKGKTVSKKYIDITLSVLKSFGIKIEKNKNGYKVYGNQEYKTSKTLTVEGDYSGASFMLSLGAINGEITVKNLNKRSPQGDRKIISVLKKFGAKIESVSGGYKVSKSSLTAVDIDVQDIPDIVQPLAVVASFSKGVTIFRNAYRLTLKESDRISGIISNLKRANIKAEFDGKDLKVYGGLVKNGEFLGENDHRTVMSASILALSVSGESQILGAEAVNKSYPQFFKDVVTLGGIVNGEI